MGDARSVRVEFSPIWSLKRPHRVPSPLPPCEFTGKEFIEKDSISQKTLTRHCLCWHLGLGPPSLQNYKKYMSVVHKPLSLWYYLIPDWTAWDRNQCFWLENKCVTSQALLFMLFASLLTSILCFTFSLQSSICKFYLKLCSKFWGHIKWVFKERWINNIFWVP